MNKLLNYFNQINLQIQKAGTGNEPWRFIVSLIVLVAGFILLEILFRFARQRFQTSMEKKGFSPVAWDLSPLLPPLRLAFTALLLGLTEVLLVLPERLIQLLHGLEGLLLALAAIVLCFQLVNMLDRLRLTLPTNLQAEFPQEILMKLKSALRIVFVIGVAAAFIYTQKNFLPEWLRQYAFWRYLLVLALAYIVIMMTRLIDRFLTGMMENLKDSEERIRLHLVIRSTIWPIRLLMATIIVYTVKEILPLPVLADRIAEGAIGLLTTLSVVIFCYRLVDVAVHELSRFARKEDNSLDEIFVRMVRIITRVLVIVVGAVYILRALSGKPMSTLIAGLGIGGLAVALAAQDTLKNFFGSIMIMLDKPFNVGQRVIAQGIDGTVEDIGFRSTRIRTLTGHLVTIPNEKMAGSNIENIGQRPSIRRLANITITYDTPLEKVEKALSIIKEILDNHEGLHPDFPPRVCFNEFNDASLNILMIYWYHPPNYWDFLAFNEQVNLQIMRAFEAEGIEFAFPTTTTYLAQDDHRPLHINLSGDVPASSQEERKEK